MASGNKHAIIVSYISLSLALTTTVLSVMDIHSIESVNVIIAAFGVIVTLLIGWNVFAAIKYEKIAEAVEEKQKQINAGAEMDSILISNALADFYQTVATGVVKVSPRLINTFYFQYRLAALIHASNLGNIGLCNAIIKSIIDSCSGQKIEVIAGARKNLKTQLSDVRKSGSLKDFDVLFEIIHTLVEP